MSLVNRLLRKNLSAPQLLGFILSNFIGLAIVVIALQGYEDVKSIWEDEDSFIKKDYIVLNKKVTSSGTLGLSSTSFSPEEIAELQAQSWVRKTGSFTANDFRVYASVDQGGRGMTSYMFFESIPDEFVDVKGVDWSYNEGHEDVPIIMSKDYLTLYNFGFASSAGLPQMSEEVMSSIPLRLRLSSEDGTRSGYYQGRVVGYSNRLNTILVPEAFMRYSNSLYGTPAASESSSRLIVDVSSPGDVAISRYLEEHGLEVAGDKKNSQASYLINIVTGVFLGVGGVITILSFFILMLSISLLMTKNRDKMHSLLMLGYPLSAVGAPYKKLVVVSCLAAYFLSLVAMLVFRTLYIDGIRGMTEGAASNMWFSPLIGLVLISLIILFNIYSVNKKVKGAYYS